jgi:hypothetical protein
VTTKSTRQKAAELEGELLRLNDLVRARRKQLASLEECPNKECECRRVWHEVVEKKIHHQVGKVGKQVRKKRARKLKSR